MAALKIMRQQADVLCIGPLKAFAVGLVRKIQALIGRPSVSATCQIPDLFGIMKRGGLLDRGGSFVEVGGFDGETFSNTSILADIGWRGVYVEPNRIPARLCRIRHLFNRVVVIQAAIAKERGCMEFLDMGALSSGSLTHAEGMSKVAWAKDAYLNRRVLSVPAIRLCDRVNPSDWRDLLVVDVEGMEQEVVEQVCMSGVYPRMLIIELVDLHADLGRTELGREHALLRSRLGEMGYRAEFVDSINSVFVRSPVDDDDRPA